MRFEDALREIKDDTMVGMRLPSWSPDTTVRTTYPSGDDCPYLYIANRFGVVPWVPAFPEMFNNKWEVIKL